MLAFIPAKIGGGGQKLIAYCVEEVPLLGVDKGVMEHNDEIATRLGRPNEVKLQECKP